MLYTDPSCLLVPSTRPRAKLALQTLGRCLLGGGMGRQDKLATDKKGQKSSSASYQGHLPTSKIARVTVPLKQSG